MVSLPLSLNQTAYKLSFFLDPHRKIIFFLVYATPEKPFNHFVGAEAPCRLFRLIKTWLDPVTAAKIQVIGALVISLMVQKSDVNSPVEGKVGKNPHYLYTTGFIHCRWLALGFRNHQQYIFGIHGARERKKKEASQGSTLLEIRFPKKYFATLKTNHVVFFFPLQKWMKGLEVPRNFRSRNFRWRTSHIFRWTDPLDFNGRKRNWRRVQVVVLPGPSKSN